MEWIVRSSGGKDDIAILAYLGFGFEIPTVERVTMGCIEDVKALDWDWTKDSLSNGCGTWLERVANEAFGSSSISANKLACSLVQSRSVGEQPFWPTYGLGCGMVQWSLEAFVCDRFKVKFHCNNFFSIVAVTWEEQAKGKSCSLITTCQDI